MNDSSDPQVWLRLAEEKFNYVLRDLKDENLAFFAPTCFHFQQAAEKYLKAYILARGKTFRKIHNSLPRALAGWVYSFGCGKSQRFSPENWRVCQGKNREDLEDTTSLKETEEMFETQKK